MKKQKTSDYSFVKSLGYEWLEWQVYKDNKINNKNEKQKEN